MMHAFTLTCAKFSYSWNEILQNIIYCVINKKFNIGIVFTYVLLHFHFFLFSNLCSDIVGTGVMQTAVMLRFEVSGTHFEECYVIIVLWGVT